MRLTEETLSAIEVRVSWCGDAEFVIDVRRAAEADRWQRYGRVAFPKDRDGLSRFGFDLATFSCLARTWLRSCFDEARAVDKLGKHAAALVTRDTVDCTSH